ncbi:MAG TPA: hypothetical protein VFS52_14220 [Steroidobacteraceae bacterium]|nr:hypothetical protein [Steroidobacteraceae bacterium]
MSSRRAPIRAAAALLTAVFAALWSHAAEQPKKTAHSGASAPQKPPTPQSWAQIDLTGYWVSVVTEDWRYRMITAPQGDVGSIPATAEARKLAKEWDPAKDVQTGQQCKAFGAAGIMRRPGRLHIAWADENTLRVDFDSGTQTRLLHFTGYPYPMGFTGGETPVQLRRFEAPPDTAASLQGFSAAAWKKYFDGRGFAGMGTGGGLGLPQPGQGGALMVITTRLLPGYLQSNGVPYSEQTVLTEYFNRVKLPHDEDWLIVTSIVEDPKYLYEPYITSTHFKREPDASRWHPTPCVTPPPLVQPPPSKDEQKP